MPEYQILHMKAEGTGVFAPRGAVRELWKSRDFETVVSGPSETGKTWGCIQYLDALAWRYDGAQLVMARKTYNDLIGSAVRTYQRIIGPNSPIVAYGGSRPEWFDYPNGSRIWLAGLDRPGKALSSERDCIYVNQCEELNLDDWAVLTTRVTGRGAVMPYTRIFGCCNPGPPTHFLKTRPQIRMLESKHEDNPTLFDSKGNILPQGVKTIRILDALPGIRKLRLRFGRWVQAEGVVYEDWDAGPGGNIIDRMPRGWRDWRKIRSVDFGYENPFVTQWWAIDPDGRMYLYREVYMSKRIVEDHVKGYRDPDVYTRIIQPGITALSTGESYEVTVADHDAEDRATMNRHGVLTKGAYKSIKQGIDAVTDRIRRAGDGRRRLFVLRGCTVEYDGRLAELRLPTKTESEFDTYVWPKAADGKPRKEIPVDENNHGMDAMRYAVAYVDLRGRQNTKVDKVEVWS